MNISVDGGAVCLMNGRGFGNYIFTRNLLEALQNFDKSNRYLIYSFCTKPDWFKEHKGFSYHFLKPKTLWLSTRVSVEEVKSRKDIFLALNQAIPLVSRSTIISFSHGLSFYFFPELYADLYYALKDQLLPMVKRSKYILVSSRRVKQEMQTLYPKSENIVVNNYGVPFDMLSVEKRARKKFFLFAGVSHPIKNINFLIKTFQRLRERVGFEDYKLYLAGNLKQFEDKAHHVLVFESATREELKNFYQEATAYVSASFYESYNIPVIEALSQGCPVIGLRSAIIPEFKPYVFQADGETDFIQYMMNVAGGAKKDISIDYIKKVFSWKKYVEKLTSLYTA